MSVSEVEVIELNVTGIRGLGSCTWVQAAPSQCRNQPVEGEGVAVPPAAHTLFWEIAVTALRLPVIAGTGTIDHCTPFQCSTRIPKPWEPTAQRSFADMPEMPVSRLSTPPALGLGITLH